MVNGQSQWVNGQPCDTDVWMGWPRVNMVGYEVKCMCGMWRQLAGALDLLVVHVALEGSKFLSS